LAGAGIEANERNANGRLAARVLDRREDREVRRDLVDAEGTLVGVLIGIAHASRECERADEAKRR
jgi:hypothetical protein